MEEILPVEFTCIGNASLSCLEFKDAKECLMQWNLDKSLQILKYQYTSTSLIKGNDEKVLKDFLRYVCSNGMFSGTATTPFSITYDTLTTSVMGMDFFDRLQLHGVVEKSGSIRGCYEENFDGIMVLSNICFNLLSRLQI
jgi:hypothetical protein